MVSPTLGRIRKENRFSSIDGILKWNMNWTWLLISWVRKLLMIKPFNPKHICLDSNTRREQFESYELLLQPLLPLLYIIFASSNFRLFHCHLCLFWISPLVLLNIIFASSICCLSYCLRLPTSLCQKVFLSFPPSSCKQQYHIIINIWFT